MCCKSVEHPEDNKFHEGDQNKERHETQDKLRAEKLAKRHWCEGGTRNALVKGEGVVCLHHPLPL